MLRIDVHACWRTSRRLSAGKLGCCLFFHVNSCSCTPNCGCWSEETPSTWCSMSLFLAPVCLFSFHTKTKAPASFLLPRATSAGTLSFVPRDVLPRWCSVGPRTTASGPIRKMVHRRKGGTRRFPLLVFRFWRGLDSLADQEYVLSRRHWGLLGAAVRSPTPSTSSIAGRVACTHLIWR